MSVINAGLSDHLNVSEAIGHVFSEIARMLR